MSKRKKEIPNPDSDDEDNGLRERKQQSTGPQKVYDFHKKTIEVYPERLRELNRQFLASISTQLTSEPYSVLVGNCLDYVRQYFTYEEDLLKYSPWLVARLKQCRSDITKCLTETIDVYEALARNDFDRIIDQADSEKLSPVPLSDDSSTNKANHTISFSTSSAQVRPATTSATITTTTMSSIPSFTFAKSLTTTAGETITTTTTTATSSSAPLFGLIKSGTSAAAEVTTTTTAGSSLFLNTFAKSTASSVSNTTTSGSTPPLFSFAKSTSSTSSDTTITTASSPMPLFASAKSTISVDSEKATTTTSSSLPLFSFAKTTTSPVSETTTTSSFSFKIPTTSSSAISTTTPEKTATVSPFSFSLPHTGFGTSTFPPLLPMGTSSEKTSTSLASSITSSPLKFSFAPTAAPSTDPPASATTDDNEDEPSEPPEPEKVDHEANAKLTYRCRMAVNKGGKLVKRGPVQVILKEIDGKRQLVVRSDDTLGRLFLNILWAKFIELKKNSTKDLTFICQLNPGMAEIKEGEFVMILLRFDNGSDRDDAYEKLNSERI